MRELLFAMAVMNAAPAEGKGARQPIIDVHLHSYAGEYTPVPLQSVARFVPPDADHLSPASGEEQMHETLRVMQQHNIVLAFVSAGSRTDQLALAKSWRSAAGERVRVGYAQQERLTEGEGLGANALEKAIRSGELTVLAELAPQYFGLSASDPRLADYYAMAERLDVPVGIHTGTAPPRQANRRAPKFRTHLGDPRLVEDVLIRHPKLRVWLMHAGWPYLAETKVMLQQYPELYVDVGAISWLLPRSEFHGYLKALVDAGFGNRVMFGSDQMLWPKSIALAVEGVASAPFLSDAQKADIFYNNAARFFRLSPEEVSKHHGG